MTMTIKRYEILTHIDNRKLSDNVTAALARGAELVGGVCTRDRAQIDYSGGPLSDRYPLWAQAVMWTERTAATTTVMVAETTT